ncbi:MAG: hypothetical protein IKL42_06970, partial [Clostridia bacterium]|nr:hypothetical protein [Clostridia bacterium]
MKKYELMEEQKQHNRTVYRIKALVDFSDVKAGEIGGYVCGEKNLSHEGDAWVCGDAFILDNAVVKDNAVVCG